MSNRICNSKSEPYWWKPGWHPVHAHEIQREARRPQYEAGTFLSGVGARLRARVTGRQQEQQKPGNMRQLMKDGGRRKGR